MFGLDMNKKNRSIGETILGSIQILGSLLGMFSMGTVLYSILQQSAPFSNLAGIIVVGLGVVLFSLSWKAGRLLLKGTKQGYKLSLVNYGLQSVGFISPLVQFRYTSGFSLGSWLGTSGAGVRFDLSSTFGLFFGQFGSSFQIWINFFAIGAVIWLLQARKRKK